MRTFIAVVPPAAVLDLIDGLPRHPHPGVRWTRRGQWHVTLRFLGEVPDVAPVIAALDAAPLEPTLAQLGPGVTLLGTSVLSVPVAGLDDLAHAVVAALPEDVRTDERRPFRGHLTVARLGRGTGRQVGRAVVREVAHRLDQASFVVEEVMVMRSHLGSGGARYEPLHVCQLRQPDA